MSLEGRASPGRKTKQNRNLVNHPGGFIRFGGGPGARRGVVDEDLPAHREEAPAGALPAPQRRLGALAGSPRRLRRLIPHIWACLFSE